MRGLYFDADGLDETAFGKQMYKLVERTLKDLPGEIAKSGLPCAHVLFENLVANPIQTVKAVYKDFNMEFTSEYEKF
jgi:hypothetical protein